MELSKVKILAAIAALASVSLIFQVMLIRTETPQLGTRGRVPPSVADLVTHVSHVDRVNVYVYDVPELDFSPVVKCYRKRYGVSPWQHEREELAQNTGEIWLHQALLAHPWRVLDPDKADVFYIPLYAVISQILDWGDQNDPPVGSLVKRRCDGYTHSERMSVALEYLVTRSPYFARFGGADHTFVCAWWGCPLALGPVHRMNLRRVVVGVTDKDFSKYTGWGCGKQRHVTVPYTASSFLTTSVAIGGRSVVDRDIPMFFVGSARRRVQRKNLNVLHDLSNESVILITDDHHDWKMNASTNAEHMTRSTFCFCPPGDTETSRRFFDALAAGCIPVITEEGTKAFPFPELDYSQFAVVVDNTAFDQTWKVTALARFLLSRSDDEIEELRQGARMGMRNMVYGVTDGPELSDMQPFHGTAANFLREARIMSGLDKDSQSNAWECWVQGVDPYLALRTSASIPPPPLIRIMVYFTTTDARAPSHYSLQSGDTRYKLSSEMRSSSPPHLLGNWELETNGTLLSRGFGVTLEASVYSQGRYWLYETETIVDEANSLLFCAPPNTGSLQVRMFAKRMKGISDWDASKNWALLFDAGLSGLHVLDSSDVALMNKIYRDNGSGWIKIGFVRDPVTRLLSAYLDLVRTLLWNDSQDRLHGQPQPVGEKYQHLLPEEERLRMTEGWPAWYWRRTWYQRGTMDEVKIPTFAEVLEVVRMDVKEAPPSFRPVSNMCGATFSPFDAIIPFERLKTTATEVFKSLPGDIWEEYGASGWGPYGADAFMEFDYGGAVQQTIENADLEPLGETLNGLRIPRRASDLFGPSCRWTEYYTDITMLDKVAFLYEADYSLYGWYSISHWKEEFKRCQTTVW